MPTEADVTLRVVLRYLADYGPIARPELVDGVGLARATTSSVVNELMRRGLVSEIASPGTGRRGRPTNLLDLDDEQFAVVGLEIGLDRVLAGAFSLRGRHLIRLDEPVEVSASNPRALLRVAASVAYQVIEQVTDAGRRLLGTGVSVTGLVDATSGTIKYVPSLGWRDVAVRAGVESALSAASAGPPAPVIVDSGANFGVLAERRARLRGGGAVPSLVYLTGTYGISAGIMAGDRLWRGARGLAGEVGHLILDPGGQRCVCGRRGCFETRAGVHAILAAAGLEQRSLVGDGPAAPTHRDVPASAAPYPIPAATALSAAVDELVRRAEAGDPQVLAALAEAGHWLGIGAAAVCAMLDPRLVVLGGHYTRLTPWLLEPARTSFVESLLVADLDPPDVEPSVLGSWGSVEGAALAVLDQMLDGIRPLPANHDQTHRQPATAG
ncbi:transcriptional regulator [Longispora fulva]|uniref:Putative NBD/HSP70 family sugar kinase n=1 Tax=Longispora fulva TaxID=619741 RepID=A0A8J7KUI0_9ACTN|nr:ROK family transcriptional regulator [Longispora fulva]MBG6134042.1 putative NBD/HSP70 family sugar kinase [Longispora fulva]GIG63560.1 transcriptional regulator [Longispora fulva]